MTGVARQEREQRLVFGEVAAAYDRRRPSYPAKIVDAIVAFADLEGDETTPVVEVGAGTGKASVLFARRGLALRALEPSPQMAAFARANLAPFPNATLEVASFEDWQPAPHEAGLIFAAQSWHWVSPEGRYLKASFALKPQGALAVFWNLQLKRPDDMLTNALAAAYGDLAIRKPRLIEASSADSNNWVIEEIESSGLFSPVTVVREPWTRTYSTEDWLELLSTQSDHRMLDPEVREALFERVGAALAAHGDRIEVDYVTVAFLARTLGSTDER